MKGENVNTIITKLEAGLLTQARDTLEEIERRCREQGQRVKEESFALGFLAGTADAAEEAIFDVLNVAGSYLDCEEADAAIRDRLARREEARGEAGS